MMPPISSPPTRGARPRRAPPRRSRPVSPRRVCLRRRPGRSRRRPYPCARLPAGRGLRVAVVAQRHDQQFRRERLTGVPRGALRLAATAFGAGGEVENALPGEILELSGAEGIGVGVDVLHVEGLAVRHHRLDRAERDTAVGLTLEVDVRERGEPVPGHTPREVAADQQQEQAARHQFDEREDRDQHRALGQDLGDLHREEVGGGVGVVVGGDLARLHQNHAEALDQDDRFDHIRRAEFGTAEAREPVGHSRVVQLADDDQRHDADHGADAEDLVQQVVGRPVTEDRPVEFGIESLAVCLEEEDEAREEADHHEPVRPADGPEFVHPGVGEEFDQHLLDAREERPPAIGSGLADHDGPRDSADAAEERRPTQEAERRPNRAQRQCQGIHVATFL